MRKRVKIMALPREGEKRIKNKFIWFPTRLPIDKLQKNMEEGYTNLEDRWLERADVVQELVNIRDGYPKLVWYDIAWAS